MFSNKIREGTRGGQGLFKWDDVKEDKDRENYLGHSLKAPVGRWQNNKDLTWYAKKSEAEKKEALDDELDKIRQQEADALALALGYKGPRLSKYVGEEVKEDDIKKAVKLSALEQQGRGFSMSNHQDSLKKATSSDSKRKSFDLDEKPKKAKKDKTERKHKKERSSDAEDSYKRRRK